ncbi:ribonuclease H-like domain-containing protein [Tanacetum coccineum]
MKVYFDMTIRQKVVFECLHAPHAQDFIIAILIDELGQHMSSVDAICPVCRKACLNSLGNMRFIVKSSRDSRIDTILPTWQGLNFGGKYSGGGGGIGNVLIHGMYSEWRRNAGVWVCRNGKIGPPWCMWCLQFSSLVYMPSLGNLAVYVPKVINGVAPQVLSVMGIGPWQFWPLGAIHKLIYKITGVIDSGLLIGHIDMEDVYSYRYEEIVGGYVLLEEPQIGRGNHRENVHYNCVARTPQQNGVAERRNGTLIEAARTMLADSKLPTTFWAEVVNTACYITYGKFDGKADEGFFVRYSLNSKAFRVFNSRTRIVEENLHIRFSESTPNVARGGPDWLFDIDALTRTMNYEPIVAGTQSNGFASTKPSDNAGQARKETKPVKNHILLPLWPADPPFSQDLKSS